MRNNENMAKIFFIKTTVTKHELLLSQQTKREIQRKGYQLA